MSDKGPKIYGLGLHGSTDDAFFHITRVPGGWIYETRDDGNTTSTVFVPFNNEFQKG